MDHSLPFRHEIGTHRRRGARGQAFDVIVRCFADTIGADTALIVSHTNGATEMVASWAREGHELSVSWGRSSLLGQALRSPRPLLDPSDPVAGVAAINAIAAPISSHRGPLGAIYAGFSPPTDTDVEALGWTAESYARLAGLCIAGDLTLAAVLGSVGFDTLTGCLSYAGLIEVVRAEIQRSLRGDHRLACCFLDLDDFKRVNDKLGHLEGNRVLTAVGRGLRGAARPYDSVGRFGGDEFVVLLPETGAADGEAIAARYRAAVLRSISDLRAASVGVSVGVAEWDGNHSPARLLAAADCALAAAKGAGGVSAETQPDGLLELTRDLRRIHEIRGDAAGDRQRNGGSPESLA